MLPAVGDTIEVKPPGAADWTEGKVTRSVAARVDPVVPAGFCIGKPRAETWFSESVEDELWRIPVG